MPDTSRDQGERDRLDLIALGVVRPLVDRVDCLSLDSIGSRGHRLHSWDRLLFARLRDGGAAVFRQWQTPVPRRLGATDRERLRADLARALDAVAESCLRPSPGREEPLPSPCR